MWISAGLFAAVMALTFWSVLKEQDFWEIVASVRKMSWEHTMLAVCLALCFVSLEGGMIWYLLRGLGEQNSLLSCLSYSFTGFFFSGITPSATGGQPMQLYYMKKDGSSLSAASVVLMTVAVCYKFALVCIGFGLLLFWGGALKTYLREYYLLYVLGLLLHIVLVSALLSVMLSPNGIRKVLLKAEGLLVRMGLWKQSGKRREKIEQFLAGYQETVRFLRGHKKLLGITLIFTFLQRLTVFVLTYAVYAGMGLSGASLSEVSMLQASVCIAVDMLPVPGAQGITEAMYRSVYSGIFPADDLIPSLCVVRGISFYLMMAVGGIWSLMRACKDWTVKK
ncbi:MAG: flippase-like domain-containing protein [Muribaculaceae bacterium]|nr:flippase-like domain-containing protein [Roseburia sp.]MCM1430555.1 flippase-like domain-containing protein [Muribaculaceae bacterium]MCM1492662.1 flippase-like domain-containing protein [Muribaculaceae bacterium]